MFYTLNTNLANSRQATIVEGYLRKFQRSQKSHNKKNKTTIIPGTIFFLLLSYYGNKIVIFGVGENEGTFGSNPKLKNSGRLTPLIAMMELVLSASDIHPQNSDVCLNVGQRFVYGGKKSSFELSPLQADSTASANTNGTNGTNGTNAKAPTYFYKYDIGCQIEVVSDGLCAKSLTVLGIDERFYSYGSNEYGQFGIGNKESEFGFNKPLTSFFQSEKVIIKQIKAGFDHVLYLTSAGTVYGCGDNVCSQLGIPHSDPSYQSVYCDTFKIPHLPANIKFFAVGSYHNVFITDTNDVWCFGNNKNGDLGIFADENGDMLSSNRDVHSAVQHPYFKKHGLKVSSADCGHYHSGFIDMDMKAYFCGSKSHGKLGKAIADSSDNKCVHSFAELPGMANIRAKQISLGNNHTLLLTDDNQLYCFGNNKHQQCLANGMTECTTPHLWDKETFAYQNGTYFSNIVRIIAGCDNTMIIAE